MGDSEAGTQGVGTRAAGGAKVDVDATQSPSKGTSNSSVVGTLGSSGIDNMDSRIVGRSGRTWPCLFAASTAQ